MWPVGLLFISTDFNSHTCECHGATGVILKETDVPCRCVCKHANKLSLTVAEIFEHRSEFAATAMMTMMNEMFSK